MEICVLYGLGLIPDEAVEAKVTLDEVARRYGLAEEDYVLGLEEFERWSDPVEEARLAKENERQQRRRDANDPENRPSEFSLEDVGKQFLDYMQPGRARGGNGAAPRVPLGVRH